MATAHAEIREPDLLASLLTDEVFHPPEPQSLDETGISPVVIETLICKYLLQIGSTSGREIAQRLCLPLGILEDMLLALRSRQVLVHHGCTVRTQLAELRGLLHGRGHGAAGAGMKAACRKVPGCVGGEQIQVGDAAGARQRIPVSGRARHQLRAALRARAAPV